MQAPLYFERNDGQTDRAIDFVSRGPGYTIFLSSDEAVVSLRKKSIPSESKPGKTSAAQNQPTEAHLRMSLVGASRQARGQGLDQRSGTANYLIGNDPAKWRTAVPLFSKVQYEGVYPGVDLIYYGSQRELEYDFIVHPFADPQPIAFNLAGADLIEIDADGGLVLHTAVGKVCWRKPYAYQDTSNGRQVIPAKFVLRHGRQVRFELGSYDRAQPLIIDPKLYATYLGGSGADFALGIAVDSSGNVFVAGDTSSLNFPTKLGYRTTSAGSNDVFVSKLNSTGTDLIYSTYIGGSGDDFAGGLALDAGGNVFVTGYTDSPNFPTRNAAYTGNAGFYDIFVTKLTANGSNLVYSTYLGGAGDDFGRAIALDGGGSAYVTGRTYSKGTGTGPFPTTQGAFQGNNGNGNAVGADAFVTKFNTNGAVSYSTFLGGQTEEKGNGIAVDSSGNAYIAGEVSSFPIFPNPPSSDFPVLNAFQPNFNQGSLDPLAGTSDGFLTKLNATGSALIFSTFLGGYDNDTATGVAVDSSGRIALAGITSSSDFPVLNAAQPINAGSISDPFFPGPDAFVTQFQSNGTALRYSTYLGGSIDEFPFLLDRFGIAIDNFGNLYIAGQTGSFDFPITPGADQTNSTASIDAFVAKINPAVSGPASLIYASILSGNSAVSPGGADNEGGPIAVDSSGNFYVAGITSATNFPVTAGVFRATNSGGYSDAFIAKFSSPRDLSVTMMASQDPVLIGSNVTYTIRINNNGPTTFSGVTNFVQFPTNVQFGTITTSSGSQAILSPGLVVFNLGTLTNNASVVQSITLTNVTPGKTTNTATLTSIEIGLEPNQANNVAAVVSTVLGIADVTLAQSAAPSPTFATSNLVYTIGITNKGPSPATGIVVSNALPSGLAFVAAAVTQGSFTSSNGIVLWNIGTLANGAGARIQITNVALAAGNVTNVPVVTAVDADFSPANNSSSLVTAVIPIADVGLGMTASANSVPAGSNVVFTLWVTNRGPSAATSIVLTNPFPAGAAFVSATTPSGTTNLSAGGIGFNLGPLASNATVAATLTLKALGSTSSLLNSAGVTNSSAADPVPGNNLAAASVTVNENANMPLLNILLNGGNVILFWSTNATAAGFILQAKVDLATNVPWTNVPNPPVTVGNQSFVTNAPSGTIKHYRLFK